MARLEIGASICAHGLLRACVIPARKSTVADFVLAALANAFVASTCVEPFDEGSEEFESAKGGIKPIFQCEVWLILDEPEGDIQAMLMGHSVHKTDMHPNIRFFLDEIAATVALYNEKDFVWKAMQ